MTWSFGLVGDLLGGLALAGVGLWAARPNVRPLLWREVRFPATLRAEQVEAVLAHVAGRREPVVFVIDAREESIRFRVGAPRGAIESITGALVGIAPELRLDTGEVATSIAPLAGARAWWSGSWPLLRGQVSPRLNFAEVLARGRIVLVRLPSGLLGAGGQLLASLLLWQFFMAVEARSALPEVKRRPFFAYVDEVGALGGLPLPLDGLLERARGHGVGLTLAPQSLSQLSPSLRSALLANVGSLVAFRLAADEAKSVARELPELTGEQVQHLERFEVVLRLSRGPGDVTATMTGKTLPPSAPHSDGAAIRALTGKRWGATLDQVDAELARRLGVAPSDRVPSDDDPPGHSGIGPVGVRRRQP